MKMQFLPKFMEINYLLCARHKLKKFRRICFATGRSFYYLLIHEGKILKNMLLPAPKQPRYESNKCKTVQKNQKPVYKDSRRIRGNVGGRMA
jgi:hypothetical protein